MRLFFKNFGKRFSTINSSQKLNPLSFIVVLLLDIFILVNLFIGLDNQKDLISKPNEYIPNICKRIIINQDWVDENRIEKLSYFVLSHYTDIYRIENKNKPIHPICRDLYTKLKFLRKDKELIKLLRKRERLATRYWSYESFQRKNNESVIAIRNNMLNIDKEINNLPEIKSLWKSIDQAEKSMIELRDDYREINFFYPLKVLLLQLLFLIPLLIVFIFWNQRSEKKNKDLQSFISLHLLTVTLIPIFIKICETILDLIPNKIIKVLIDFLKSVKLIAFWHYFLIVFAAAITFLIIYLIQRYMSNSKRVMAKRLTRGKCVYCAKKIKPDTDFCPFCGSEQKIKCPNCGTKTALGGDFCTNCGEKIEYK